MDTNHYQQIVESIDPEGVLSQDQIQEIVNVIKEEVTKGVPEQDEERYALTANVTQDQIKTLEAQMKEEGDWRKRASIAAKIIMLKIDL